MSRPLDFCACGRAKNPLDASAIHPESYAIATAVLERAGLDLKTPPAERAEPLNALLQRYTVAQLAAELGTGVPTLTDILEQGRPPRSRSA
ncbi:hypothetical protein [Candidatus Flexifilum breve]|uniref:hypothetical protein n=1 Tax=Candidatus Flexifilum breve TaxID=3140694 RepID=UPI0031CC90D4